METILVAGANGKTGREIINILQNHSSYEPVAMVRNED
jgi:N-acetyl-gamma-glutamylphosphate reductase